MTEVLRVIIFESRPVSQTTFSSRVSRAGGDRGVSSHLYSNVPVRTEVRTGSVEDRKRQRFSKLSFCTTYRFPNKLDTWSLEGGR